MSNYFCVFLFLFWKQLGKHILCSITRQRSFPFLPLIAPAPPLEGCWPATDLVVSSAIWKGRLVKQRYTV